MPLEEALRRFAQVPMLQIGVQGRADWVANGVLYVPVGFFTAFLMTGPGLMRRSLASLGALFFGVALAFAVEFTQLFFPQRTVSRNDLIAEALGCLLGVLLAWRGQGWLPALWTLLQGRWRAIAGSLVPAGATLVLVLSLFPFDLLISARELADKVGGGLWGWWVAPAFLKEPGARRLAGLVAELLVVIPLGLLWARSRQLRLGLEREAPLLLAFALGAVLGLAVEVGQWFIASGVSQGISVLDRGLGWMLGAWLWNRRSVWGVQAWRSGLRRLWLPLVLLHAVAATALNGWFGSAWRTPAEAWARLTGGELHFVPFYYHYYSSEAAALYSLLAVALLYAPLGALAWARGWAPWHAAWTAGIVTLMVEAGKLFPLATRPDPTNLLIGAASAAAAAVVLQRFTAEDVHPTHASPVAEIRPTHHAATKVLARLQLLMVVALALFWLARFPVFGAALGLGLGCAAALVWWRPVLLPGLAIAALLALDLSPWSGSLYFDELDMLLLLGLSVAWARLSGLPSTVPPPDPRLATVFLLLCCSVLISSLLGWQPWHPQALGDPGSPLSPWHALRLAKGLLWALGLILLMRRLNAAGEPVAWSLAVGMVLGLLGVVGFVLWERAAFVGLWDTATPYRVAGPVGPMKLGGAYLDACLVAALPFALLGALRAPRRWQRMVCAVAALGVVYSVAVTFTRTTYAAAAMAGLLSLLAVFRPAPGQRRPVWVWAAMAVLLSLLVYPIVTGPFALSRMSHVAQDLGVRVQHWQYSLALAREGRVSWLFGQGLGRFPAAVYWSRAAEGQSGARMAVHRFVREGRTGHLQLGPGPQHYVDQIIDARPGQALELELSLRSTEPGGQLQVLLCHKWLLSSDDCIGHSLKAPEGSARWQRMKLNFDLGALGADRGGLRRPVRISLHNVGASRIDIDRIALRDAAGEDLIRNGAFAAGGDHWTFTSDDHLAWHVKNMALAVWFDQGLLGIVAWAGVLGLALLRATKGAWAGSVAAQALLASLVGLLVVGLFDSLIDEPRFLLLLLMLCGLAATEVRISGKPASSRAA